MCKLGQLDTIFLAQKALLMTTLLNIVYLYCFIARRRH
jgi:hypothetical protein